MNSTTNINKSFVITSRSRRLVAYVYIRVNTIVSTVSLVWFPLTVTMTTVYCVPASKEVKVAVLTLTAATSCFVPGMFFNSTTYFSTSPESGTSHVTVNELKVDVGARLVATFGSVKITVHHILFVTCTICIQKPAVLVLP